jgi:hypothetical protein
MRKTVSVICKFSQRKDLGMITASAVARQEKGHRTASIVREIDIWLA